MLTGRRFAMPIRFIVLHFLLIFFQLSAGDALEDELLDVANPARITLDEVFHDHDHVSHLRRLMEASLLDYDYTGPNPKHDPRKKGGHN